MLLVIWDVDGTLVDAAGAGHRALVRAVASVVGHPVNLDGLDYAGRTDRALIEESLARSGGRPASDWPLVREEYTRLLQEELSVSAGRALPGAQAVLEAVAGQRPMRQVLGTGNLEAGAWIKLGHYGLAHYFATGGFGDSHRTRPPILREAIANATRHYESRFDHVVIVGDTPRDADAAEALGVPCLLVATGRYPAGTLAEYGPHVLANLTDTERVLAFFQDVERGRA
jgi:phosphoglycolate phosphatase